VGAETKIGWTDHTFNPWWGCAHVSPGCVRCYAETWAKRTGHDVWGKDGPRRLFGDKHWNEPLRWNREAEARGERARVFCASMADVFEEHPALPEQRDRLWSLIDATPALDWLLLTKRPENVRPLVYQDWLRTGWPENVWLGVTAEDQQRADERIPLLLDVPTPVRFVSAEPLLGPLDLSRWMRPHAPDCRDVNGEPPWCTCGRDRDGYLDWLIVGGESGPGARPMDLAWARGVVAHGRDTGVAVFVKQLGTVLAKQLGAPGKGETLESLPSDLQVREWPRPKVAA
jgi:protein gp37